MLRNGFVAVILAAVSCTFMISMPAAAVSNGGIGGRPANPDPQNPRSGSIFIYNLDKGAEKDDAVYVVNNTTETQRIELYVVDGTISSDGAFTCKQRSEEVTDAGGWATLAKQEVTLGSMQTEKVGMTVRIPRNVEVGEHNACVVFQRKNDPGETSGGVRVQTRQAVRLAVTIPGKLHRDVTLHDFSLVTSPVGRQYHVTVRNVGNVSVDADVRIKVRDAFGRNINLSKDGKMADSLGGMYTVVPDFSSKKGVNNLELNFEENTTFFWGGFYTAQASAQYNSDITKIGSTSGETITQTTPEIKFFVMPSLMFVLIVLMLILTLVAGIAWLIGRRYGTVVRKSRWGAYTVKSGDSIESIAAKYNMRWKRLARLNGIRAPYSLKTGRRLSVPKKRHKG